MKKQICLFIAVLALVFMSHSVVSANDPPHNPDSDVDCGDCHGEALFSTDPGSMTPEQLKDAYNNMCKRCHTSAAGSYHGTAAPVVGAHNDTIVQGSFTFDTSCIDCHHPHYQSDQFWYGRKYYGSEYRLFTGQGSVTSTLTNPTRTVITYNPATLSPKSGSSWDTSGPPDNDVEVGLANLAAKTTSGRGAAFLPNTASPYNSHMIESIDTAAKTITVKGTVSSVATAGFAIAYGQVVKRDLPLATASGNTVILLDRTGQYSYAHSDGLGAGGKDSTVTGICQVCHTQTGHWRNTPDAARDNHFSGENCMNCHQHLTGFKPNFVDHYDLATPYVTDYTGGSEETCVSCHVSPGTYNVDRDYITYVHNFTCENCHVDFDSPPTLKVGPNGNGDAQLTDGSNTCSDCHGTTGGYNYSVDFENAHDVKDHDGLVGKTGTTIVSNCNYCHTGDIINLDATPDVHNDNCFNCHTNTGNDGQLHGGNTGSSYNGVVSVGTAAGHTIGTTSNCSECHATRASDFSSHDHSNATYHEVGGSVRTDSTVAQGAGDTSQNSAQLCSACHNTNGGGLTGWDDIYVEHNSDCNTCHNATRDTSASGANTIGATIQTVIGANGNPTNCSACHRDKSTTFAAAGSVHGDHKQEGWVRGAGTSCVGCHDQDNNDDHTQYITVIHKNNCALCHTNPGTGNYTLKAGSPAEGHEGGPNTCVTCHEGTNGPDYASDFSSHLVQDHGLVDGIATCISCHDASPQSNIITVTHTNTCTNCHTNTGNDGRLAVSGTNGQSTGHIIGTTSYCNSCHGATGGFNYDSDFENAHDNGDHMTGAAADALTTSPECTTTCHTANTAASIVSVTHATTDGCANCHTNTGSNGSLHAGDLATSFDTTFVHGVASGHSIDSTSSCRDCHADHYASFYAGHQVGTHGGLQLHDGLAASIPACASCHPGTPFDVWTVIHSPSSCGTCHTAIPNGTLKTTAIGDGSGHVYGSSSDCADCHSISGNDYTTDFGSAHDVKSHLELKGTSSAIPASNCVGCHTGDIVNLDGTADVHNDNCQNCHSNTTTNGVLHAGDIVGSYNNATVVGDAVNNHTIGSTSSCADCHNARNTSFESHIHSDATNHKTGGSGTTIAQGAGDVSQESGNLCSDCHRDLNGGATTLTSWDEIAYEHDLDGTKDGVGSCVTCHNATRDVCSDGGKCTQSGTTVQDVIAANGDPTRCAACHVAKIDSLSSDATHGTIDHVGAGKATFDAQCAGCHDQGGAGDNTRMMAIHNASGQGCGTCHVSAGGAGPLVNKGSGGTYASEAKNYEAVNPSGGSCTTCHGAYGSNFSTAHMSVDHKTEALSDALAATASCTTNCHDGSSATNIIISTHNGSCTRCHTNATTDGRLKSATNGDASGHTIDAASTCAACHAAYNTNFQAAHDVGDHSRLSSTAKCTGCHTGTIISDSRVHGNTCTLCHTNLAGNGSLLDGTTGGTRGVFSAGDATGHDIATTSACDDCHTLYSGSFNAHQRLTDHDKVGTTASCISCHSGPVITVVHGNACAWCHNAALGNDGSLRNGTDAGTPEGTTSVGDATGHDILVASSCADCHADHASDFDGGHLNEDHTGVAGSANCTSNCHDGSSAANIVANTHGNTCTLCHANTGANGSLISGANGDASSGAGSCVSCHGGAFAYNTDFDGAHDGGDHRNSTDTTDMLAPRANCTTTCHDGSSLANIIGITHNNDCTNCHTNTGANGELVNAANGLAQDHTVDTQSNCAVCHNAYHVNYQNAHDVKDHNGVVKTGVSGDWAGNPPVRANCAGCHDDDVVNTTAAADTHSDTCINCHSNNAGDGTLIDGGNNYGDATGHLLGTTSSCNDCHAADGYFDAHTHTTHDVQHRDGTDQSAGSDCESCHNDAGANLNTWNDIYVEHLSSCATCHDATRDINPGSPTGITVYERIVTGSSDKVSPTGCLHCHADKSASHGGHDPGHFDWTASCGTASCHDSGTNTDIINDVHGNTCTVCHTTSSGGAGTAILGSATNGVDGDARLGAALGDYTTATCLTCHPADGNSGAFNTTDAAHHVSANNYVANGNCTQCHTDPRTTPTGMSHSPYQLACRACHVDVSGNTVTVKAITEGAAGSGGTGSQAGNTRATATNHTFTITAGTGVGKILNYGACLYCHGVTGAAAGRGAPSQGSSTIVPYHAQKTNAQMGGSSTAAGDKLIFRGGSVFSWSDTTVGTEAFYGHGRGRINGNRAKFSLPEEYVKATFGSNIRGEAENYNITNAPNAFTYFEMVVNNASLTKHIPVFDTDYIAGTQCSGSCDTVTMLNDGGNECRDHAGDAGTCVTGRVVRIRATSSDSTGQLKFVYGNEITTMSCSSGTCTGSVDYSGSPTDYFNPNNPENDTVCVISDKGGSDCKIIDNTR